MLVKSLGYRTDLALRELEGSEITELGDCLVVRSPANPAFRWGNFILLREPPGPGTAQDWIARFRGEFPGADYVALGIDLTRAGAVNSTELAAAGLRLSADSVLTTAAIRQPRHLSLDADCRPLATERDWNQAAALGIACNPGPHAEQEFLLRRMETRRRLTEEGHGAWFGAFRHERLLAQLGIFRAADGIARFQDVETHPDSRRTGLAGTLVYRAARHAMQSLGAHTLVIVADPEGSAIRLYRSLGFTDQEEQAGLEWLATPAGRG